MNSELSALDKKIGHLLEAFEGLRNENAALRAKLVTAENEKRQMSTDIDTVRTRLEVLLQKLPEGAVHE